MSERNEPRTGWPTDDAIDAVAARLTAVPADIGLSPALARIRSDAAAPARWRVDSGAGSSWLRTAAAVLMATGIALAVWQLIAVPRGDDAARGLETRIASGSREMPDRPVANREAQPAPRFEATGSPSIAPGRSERRGHQLSRVGSVRAEAVVEGGHELGSWDLWAPVWWAWNDEQFDAWFERLSVELPLDDRSLWAVTPPLAIDALRLTPLEIDPVVIAPLESPAPLATDAAAGS